MHHTQTLLCQGHHGTTIQNEPYLQRALYYFQTLIQQHEKIDEVEDFDTNTLIQRL